MIEGMHVNRFQNAQENIKICVYQIPKFSILLFHKNDAIYFEDRFILNAFSALNHKIGLRYAIKIL